MSAASDAIEALKTDPPNDAETLAQMFETPTIDFSDTLQQRLMTILEATEGLKGAPFPGLQLDIEFHDKGFKLAFKDPWEKSDNQVGHFLTAVGLSFNPDKVTQSFMGRRLRDWLGADSQLTNEEVALRLTVGHELAPDPGPGSVGKGAAIGGAVGAVGGAVVGAGVSALDGFRTQVAAATPADIQTFRTAVALLGSAGVLQLNAAKQRLLDIKVNPTMNGNSQQDLLLSCYGWWLGQEIKTGRMMNKTTAANWVRNNLKAVTQRLLLPPPSSAGQPSGPNQADLDKVLKAVPGFPGLPPDDIFQRARRLPGGDFVPNVQSVDAALKQLAKAGKVSTTEGTTGVRGGIVYWK